MFELPTHLLKLLCCLSNHIRLNFELCLRSDLLALKVRCGASDLEGLTYQPNSPTGLYLKLAKLPLMIP